MVRSSSSEIGPAASSLPSEVSPPASPPSASSDSSVEAPSPSEALAVLGGSLRLRALGLASLGLPAVFLVGGLLGRGVVAALASPGEISDRAAGGCPAMSAMAPSPVAVPLTVLRMIEFMIVSSLDVRGRSPDAPEE